MGVFNEYADTDRYWSERVKEAEQWWDLEQLLDVDEQIEFYRQKLAKAPASNLGEKRGRAFMQGQLDYLIKQAPQLRRIKREAKVYLNAARRCRKLMTKNQE